MQVDSFELIEESPQPRSSRTHQHSSSPALTPERGPEAASASSTDDATAKHDVSKPSGASSDAPLARQMLQNPGSPGPDLLRGPAPAVLATMPDSASEPASDASPMQHEAVHDQNSYESPGPASMRADESCQTHAEQTPAAHHDRGQWIADTPASSAEVEHHQEAHSWGGSHGTVNQGPRHRHPQDAAEANEHFENPAQLMPGGTSYDSLWVADTPTSRLQRTAVKASDLRQLSVHHPHPSGNTPATASFRHACLLSSTPQPFSICVPRSRPQATTSSQQDHALLQESSSSSPQDNVAESASASPSRKEDDDNHGCPAVSQSSTAEASPSWRGASAAGGPVCENAGRGVQTALQKHRPMSLGLSRRSSIAFTPWRPCEGDVPAFVHPRLSMLQPIAEPASEVSSAKDKAASSGLHPSSQLDPASPEHLFQQGDVPETKHDDGASPILQGTAQPSDGSAAICAQSTHTTTPPIQKASKPESFLRMEGQTPLQIPRVDSSKRAANTPVPGSAMQAGRQLVEADQAAAALERLSLADQRPANALDDLLQLCGQVSQACIHKHCPGWVGNDDCIVSE